MGGLVIDIFLEYIARMIMRAGNIIRSRSWTRLTGKVTSSSYIKAGYGCDIIEISYKYRVQGEPYTGLYKKPWIFSGAEEYADSFNFGSHVIIRVKPDEPSKSVMERAGSIAESAAKAQSN